MSDAARTPTPRELRHMAANHVAAADRAVRDGRLHRDSLHYARMIAEADLLRGLAEALDKITPDGLALLAECVEMERAGYSEYERGLEWRRRMGLLDDTLAAIRALLTTPDADGAGRVVGRIEAQLTEGG